MLSLTRDRLSYTQHCFGRLQELAGCDYDHYVLDQGSQDGTVEWLAEGKHAGLLLLQENIGISRGWNVLLDLIRDQDYDVCVTFDNDCEVVTEGTLAACAEIAAKGDWIVAPTVMGLNNPPRTGPPITVNGYRVAPYHAIGGIFRAMPGDLVRDFRFSESNPLWGYDEADVGRAALERVLGMGYLLDWYVNHYETTSGQHARYPAYFERTLLEGKPAL